MKGMAASMGYEATAGIAHKLEDLLAIVRDGLTHIPETFKLRALQATAGTSMFATALVTLASDEGEATETAMGDGPGECGAFWDAPAFMAIDNCPSTLIFGQVGFAGGCNQYSQNFCGINACGDSGGYFFDLKNNSTGSRL